MFRGISRWFSERKNSEYSKRQSGGRFLLRHTRKYENVSGLDSIPLGSRNDLRITMKFMFSSSRLYLSSLDYLSASTGP